MSHLISSTELTLELESILPSSKRLTVVSAYVTQPAISWLSRLISENAPEVVVVGRFIPIDFISGASSLDALRNCINNGYQVKALSNLHAKIYQIDNDTIFNGSANFTGKGLALVDDSNLESCNRMPACSKSRIFIEKIVNSAQELSSQIINDMEVYLNNISSLDAVDVPVTWPEEIISQSDSLFISDFPLGQPGEIVSEYTLNPSLTFSQIEKEKANFGLSSLIFKKSKAYKWIKNQIKENKNERDLGFGQISRLLHEVLSGEPAPSRYEIKDLQANLFAYIKIYAFDEVEIYVPGRRSEVLRLK